ncbi:sugar isomerase [Vibrio sp. ER1A]|nr:sugar isomerase [Vibrio sp. ER1A]
MKNVLSELQDIIESSGIFLTEKELSNLEITDFGLGSYRQQGLAIHTYINTDRCCAKELIMLPNQTCPEHIHPTLGTIEGKEETFRCRYGRVSIFIAGVASEIAAVAFPKDINNFTVFKEVVLEKGQQLTLAPNSKHWFKAHEKGAVVSEFSTTSNDETDIFTNPDIKRSSMLT